MNGRGTANGNLQAVRHSLAETAETPLNRELDRFISGKV